jgi:hypothetical protein
MAPARAFAKSKNLTHTGELSMLRKLLATALLCFAGMVGTAYAQTSPVILPSGCGSANFNVGIGYLTTDSTGKLCATVGPTSSATSGLAPASSAALASSQVVCSAACNLYGLEVSADSTLSGAAWWIMVFNAASAPGDGAITPAKCFAMASGATNYTVSWPTPIRFSTGVTVVASTTGCFTKTASAHAFISGDAQQ